MEESKIRSYHPNNRDCCECGYLDDWWEVGVPWKYHLCLNYQLFQNISLSKKHSISIQNMFHFFFFERMLSYHIITSFKKNCFTLFCVADFVLHVKKRRENLQYLLVFICSAKSVGRGTIFKNPIVSLVLGTQVANIVLNIHCCQALNLNNVMKTKN